MATELASYFLALRLLDATFSSSTSPPPPPPPSSSSCREDDVLLEEEEAAGCGAFILAWMASRRSASYKQNLNQSAPHYSHAHARSPIAPGLPLFLPSAHLYVSLQKGVSLSPHLVYLWLRVLAGLRVVDLAGGAGVLVRGRAIVGVLEVICKSVNCRGESGGFISYGTHLRGRVSCGKTRCLLVWFEAAR